MRPRIRRLRFTWIFAPGGRLSHEAYNVERYDTYSAKFKIIKVRIEVKLLKIYFVVRPWLHQQRIKRLNQRMKRTNTRFKQQSDQFVREREREPGRASRAGRDSLSEN